VPLFCGTPVTQQLAAAAAADAGNGLRRGHVYNPSNPRRPDAHRAVHHRRTEPVSSGIGASRVPIVVDPTRRRTYWFTNTNIK
jgi:hypothetical protein